MGCEKYYKVIDEESLFIVFYMDIDNCHFSKNAFLLLNQKNLKFRAFCIKDLRKGLDIKDEFIKCINNVPEYKVKPEHNTLPIIFYNRKFIGGYTDLVEFIQNK